MPVMALSWFFIKEATRGVLLICLMAHVSCREPVMTFLSMKANKDCLMEDQSISVIKATVDYYEVDFKDWTKTVLLTSGKGQVCEIVDSTVCPPPTATPCYCSRSEGTRSTLVMNLTAAITFSDLEIKLEAIPMAAQPEYSTNHLFYPHVSDIITEILMFDDDEISPVRNVSLTDNVTTIDFTVRGLSQPYTLGYRVNSSQWHTLRNTPNLPEIRVRSGWDKICIQYEEESFCRRSNTICPIPNEESAELPLTSTGKSCDMQLWYTAFFMICAVVQVVLGITFIFLCGVQYLRLEIYRAPVYTVAIMTVVFVADIVGFWYQEIFSIGGLDECHYISILMVLAITFVVLFIILFLLVKSPSNLMSLNYRNTLLGLSILISSITIVVTITTMIYKDVLGSGLDKNIIILLVVVQLASFLIPFPFVCFNNNEIPPEEEEDRMEVEVATGKSLASNSLHSDYDPAAGTPFERYKRGKGRYKSTVL